MGSTEKYTLCGILDEDSGQLLYINFGSSSYKTRDFIVDTLIQWWKTMTPEQKQDNELIQIKVDNGPESSGVRTQ
ncbi:Mobile element protein [Richelia intracellularis]|nr:Mobile element protein [Richelia intracellularis]